MAIPWFSHQFRYCQLSVSDLARLCPESRVRDSFLLISSPAARPPARKKIYWPWQGWLDGVLMYVWKAVKGWMVAARCKLLASQVVYYAPQIHINTLFGSRPDVAVVQAMHAGSPPHSGGHLLAGLLFRCDNKPGTAPRVSKSHDFWSCKMVFDIRARSPESGPKHARRPWLQSKIQFHLNAPVLRRAILRTLTAVPPNQNDAQLN